MKSLTKLFLGGSALAVVGLLIGAAVNTVSYLPGLDVANDATFHGNVTIGGVSHNAWPAGGSAIPGTLVTNGASATAGSLVKFGDRITNVVDAASADVQQTVCDTNKFWVAPGDGSVSSKGTVSANGFRQYSNTLTPDDAGVALPFSAGVSKGSLVCTGAVTFTFSGIVTNSSYQLLIVGCSTNSAITWPVGVHGQPPGVVEANKWLRIDLAVWDPAGSGIVANTNVVISQLPDL